MRKLLTIVIPSLAIAALALAMFVGSPRAADDVQPAKHVQKWEYTWGDADGMNKAGENGWEAFALQFNDRGDARLVWYKRAKTAAKKTAD